MTKLRVGSTVFRWTLQERTGTTPYGAAIWRCRCVCGNEKLVAAGVLTNRKSRSCGCYRDELRTSHGHGGANKSRIYRVWSNMIQRCTNAGNPEYHNYGARGISVCVRWRTFENFFADMGEPPEKHDLDRINNDGSYSPSNCRWVTRSTNLRNKRNNVLLTHAGETLTLTEWSERLGVNAKTLSYRMKNGWPTARILTEPVEPRRK